MKLDLSIEPSFIGLGPFHIAVGMNDRVWIHEIGEAGMYNIMVVNLLQWLILLSSSFQEKSLNDLILVILVPFS